jgi:serine acetyltransferase
MKKQIPSIVPAEIIEFLHSPSGADIVADLKAWCVWHSKPVGGDVNSLGPVEVLARLFRYYDSFRNLLDYRLERALGKGHQFESSFRRATDLYLKAPIGPGCVIQHGHGTWLFAEKIGADFLCNQNVTVGWAKGKPIIGDNVRIHTGAVVVGPIKIGNNVRIGPNAVVNFDVPDNSRVYAASSIVVPMRAEQQ